MEDFRRSQTLAAEEPAKLEQLAQAEAAQEELKRTSDAFAERVQHLSAKLQLVGRQLADLVQNCKGRREACYLGRNVNRCQKVGRER